MAARNVIEAYLVTRGGSIVSAEPARFPDVFAEWAAAPLTVDIAETICATEDKDVREWALKVATREHLNFAKEQLYLLHGRLRKEHLTNPESRPLPQLHSRSYPNKPRSLSEPTVKFHSVAPGEAYLLSAARMHVNGMVDIVNHSLEMRVQKHWCDYHRIPLL